MRHWPLRRGLVPLTRQPGTPAVSLEQALIPLLVYIGFFLLLTPFLDRDGDRVRRMWAWVTSAALIRYVIWRVLCTTSPPEWTAPWIFRAIYMLIELLAFYLILRLRLGDQRLRSRSADADRYAGWWKGTPPPLVDVFIPTYNESVTILERTVVGATRLEYPNYRVWLLDDGKRDWLRAWAAERNVGYLRREDNRGYKAGNLNAGLKHVLALDQRPEYIAVLDADFVLKPRFLRRVLSLMAEPDIGLVQTPQHFYNLDPFQFGVRGVERWPDDQRHFFDFVLPIEDRRDSATCCGSSFLVRVRALEAIEGFPTESVAEDTLTSLKLKSAGWKTAYLNEPLSVGLAPDGLAEFLTQRARWTLGKVQLTAGAYGPLASSRGLLGRLAFVRDAASWAFFSWYPLLLCMLPIGFWMAGTFAIQADPTEVIYYGGPVWVDFLFLSWLSRGSYLPLVTEAIDIVTGMAVVPATWKALLGRGDKRFVVTAKGTQRDRVVIHWGPLLVVLPLAIALVVAMLIGLTDPYSVIRSSPFHALAVLYGFQTVIILLMSALPCIELPKRRRDDRYPCNESAAIRCGLDHAQARIVDLSAGGAAVATAYPLQVGQSISLEVDEVGWVCARVVRVLRDGNVGLSIETLGAQREALVAKIYCSDKYIRTPEEWHFLRCLGGTLRRLVW